MQEPERRSGGTGAAGLWAVAAMSKRNDYDYLIKLLLIGDSGEEAGPCRELGRLGSRRQYRRRLPLVGAC